MAVTLVVVEPLGEKMDLYCSTAKHPHLVTGVDADLGLESVQTLPMYLAVQKVHIFKSTKAGKNLLCEQNY